jgi:hypothetical protein
MFLLVSVCLSVSLCFTSASGCPCLLSVGLYVSVWVFVHAYVTFSVCLGVYLCRVLYVSVVSFCGRSVRRTTCSRVLAFLSVGPSLLRASVYMYVHLPACLSVCLSLYIQVFVVVSLYLFMSFFLSPLNLTPRLFLRLSVLIPMCLCVSMCAFVCLCLPLSRYVWLCLSVCLCYGRRALRATVRWR